MDNDEIRETAAIITPERGRLLTFPRDLRAVALPDPPEAADGVLQAVSGVAPQYAVWRSGAVISMSLPLFDLFLLHLSVGPVESRALLTELEALVYPERRPTPPTLPPPSAG